MECISPLYNRLVEYLPAATMEMLCICEVIEAIWCWSCGLKFTSTSLPILMNNWHLFIVVNVILWVFGLLKLSLVISFEGVYNFRLSVQIWNTYLGFSELQLLVFACIHHYTGPLLCRDKLCLEIVLTLEYGWLNAVSIFQQAPADIADRGTTENVSLFLSRLHL